jgi:hypothetical protein
MSNNDNGLTISESIELDKLVDKIVFKYCQPKTEYSLIALENFDYRNNPYDYQIVYRLSEFDSDYLGSDDDVQIFASLCLSIGD